MVYCKYVRTRFGLILLTAENGAVTGAKAVLRAEEDHSCPLLEKAQKALLNYESDSAQSDTVPIRPVCTSFQLAVYKETSKIPCGETASYKEIAERIGKPHASRAVGQALSKNPIWIFIPCHRVIGKNKALTGFAGGLWMKQMLIDHEKNHLANSSAICTAFVAAPLRT